MGYGMFWLFVFPMLSSFSSELTSSISSACSVQEQHLHQEKHQQEHCVRNRLLIGLFMLLWQPVCIQSA